MICPRCGGEFRFEIGRCPDCDVDLHPAEACGDMGREKSAEASCVALRTADPTTLALARGLLTDADVPFAVHNERMIGLFPSAITGPTVDSKFRAAEIEVLESDLARAWSVLDGLEGLTS